MGNLFCRRVNSLKKSERHNNRPVSISASPDIDKSSFPFTNHSFISLQSGMGPISTLNFKTAVTQQLLAVLLQNRPLPRFLLKKLCPAEKSWLYHHFCTGYSNSDTSNSTPWILSKQPSQRKRWFKPHKTSHC